jgi:hypothetical protein
MIHEMKPDIIVFTGDLVNNISDEIISFIPVLSRLQAPHGVFSVLGNHDYGDYQQWPDAGAKSRNLQQLEMFQKEMGWRLLKNEHVVLKGTKSDIALIGVENWSAGRFQTYGDLPKSYQGSEHAHVKILLSHDPSHWNAEVTTRFTDIDLTLSGHTHGFQFGVEIPGFRWSPAQWIYKQWAGLYSENKQHIYVNRGLGFLGYPGRVGIAPEITLIELVNA